MMPLREENGFLPDFKAIPRRLKKDEAYVFHQTIPTILTAAIAPRAFYEEAIRLAGYIQYYCMPCTRLTAKLYYD